MSGASASDVPDGIVTVNDITIKYKIDLPTQHDFTGDVLVLVNGLGDDHNAWEPQLAAFLDAGYRVLRFDNRGVGGTSKPPGPYTVEMFADDLHALLKAVLDRELNTTRFHLIGVSMGGMIAQAYALRYANGSQAAGGLEMSSLSLCCTYAEPTGFCTRMFSLWSDMARAMGVPAVMREVALWCFTVPFFRSEGTVLRELETAMAQTDMPLEAYLAQVDAITRFNTTTALDSLKASGVGLGALPASKVLVLAGRTDILIPVVLSRELAERIEGCHFLTTKGGHGSMWEFPDDFNRAVLGFLASTTATNGV